MTATGERRPEISTDNSRLIGLSDSVFAFALTLLVINLKLPDAATIAREGLGRSVLDQSGSFFIWLLSFVVIALYWQAHHRVFLQLKGHDGRLIWLNLLCLLCVSFIWYPTSLVGAYSTAQFTVIFYAASLIVTSLAFTALGWYAARDPRLLNQETGPAVIQAGRLRSLTGAAIFAVSIAVSFASVSTAEYCWLLLPLSHTVLRRKAARKAESAKVLAPD